jgi:hypothetical protein
MKLGQIGPQKANANETIEEVGNGLITFELGGKLAELNKFKRVPFH